jgi:hypothetical protein
MTTLVPRIFFTALLTVGGCLESRVDEAEPGTFACEDGSECELGQSCILGVCEAAEPPRVEIRFPEAFDSIAMPGESNGPLPMSISVGGQNLELDEPHGGAENEAGIGYVELFVDGERVALLTKGNLVAGVVTDVMLDDAPGAHRITAVARTLSGERYDNAESVGTRLVWVDDGMPHVAIVSPWPGQELGLEQTQVDVEIAAINFEFIAMQAEAQGNQGHAHIHYDDSFPSCADDPACDCCYVAIAAPNLGEPGPSRRMTTSIALPPSGAGSATVSVVLRQTFHPPFEDANGNYVHDSVSILREDRGPGAADG